MLDPNVKLGRRHMTDIIHLSTSALPTSEYCFLDLRHTAEIAGLFSCSIKILVDATCCRVFVLKHGIRVDVTPAHLCL